MIDQLDLPAFSRGPSVGSDSLAGRESIEMEAGKSLEEDGKEKEHGRHQLFRDHVNRATLVLLWLIIACTALGILIFVWHMVMPANFAWLNDAQKDKLQTMLAAVILSSAMTGYVNKRIS